MVSQMIVSIRYGDTENDSRPELFQVNLWLTCTLLIRYELGKFQIAGIVNTIGVTEQGHSTCKRKPLLPFPVETFHQKGATGFREVHELRIWHIQAASLCKVVRNHLPCTGIPLIMFRWELGYPKRTVRCFHVGFRPGTAKRRTRCQKLAKPFLFIRVTLVLESKRCRFQLTKRCPWRGCKPFVWRLKLSTLLQSEPNGTHTCLIVDT